MATIRARLCAAMAGEAAPPVYAVYDWFVKNRPRVDWTRLAARGLGQLAHAPLLRVEYPHVRIEETRSVDDGGERRDVRWITDAGELHEYYRGEWRQEYLVKAPSDYAVLSRALEGARFIADDAAFERSETALGDTGVTMGQLCDSNIESRTAIQAIQIDCAGLERFSLDLAVEEPALMRLIEQMDARTVEKFRAIRSSGATMIKLWENLSIETMGPIVYRRFLAPVYGRIADVLRGTGKGLHVHYDGKLRPISADIAAMGFSGIDSLTGPPEGDLTASEARALWPDLFLWVHPNLGWFERSQRDLRDAILGTVAGAGPRSCLMISEDIPPGWQETVPFVLDTLAGSYGA